MLEAATANLTVKALVPRTCRLPTACPSAPTIAWVPVAESGGHWGEGMLRSIFTSMEMKVTKNHLVSRLPDKPHRTACMIRLKEARPMLNVIAPCLGTRVQANTSSQARAQRERQREVGSAGKPGQNLQGRGMGEARHAGRAPQEMQVADMLWPHCLRL